MLLTPAERRALLTLVSLLILGQLASIWQQRRRDRPDRELSAWLTRVETVRGDTVLAIADSEFAALPAGEADVPADSTAIGVSTPSATAGPTPAPAPTPITAAAQTPTSSVAAPPGLLEKGRIRVNLASTQDLELLPGVGPALAKRIFEDRRAHGAFRRPEDLLRVKGIGAKTLRRLVDYLDFTSPG